MYFLLMAYNRNKHFKSHLLHGHRYGRMLLAGKRPEVSKKGFRILKDLVLKWFAYRIFRTHTAS
jgi:hypothetical protein